ncbi:MAG TPA: ABC transporter ATP-binding protein, partial [Chloroflexota bacterium]|nr:ABC transporter ATP-binding protein [Chloroflexota bacterium]
MVLRRLLRMAFAQRRAAVIALTAQIIQIGFSLVLPLFLKSAVDNGLESGDYAMIVLAAAETLGVSAVRSFVWYFVTYYYRVMATAVGFELRDRLYEKLQRNRVAFHLKSHSGDLFALTATDVQAIEDFLNNGLNQAMNILVLSVSLFVVLLSMDFRLTLYALPSVIAVAVLAVFYTPLARERSRRIQNLYGQVAATLQENLTGMRVVKAFSGEAREIVKFREKIDDLYNASMRQTSLNAYTFPTMTFITALGITSVLWFGGQDVIEGRLSLGSLIAFITYLTMLINPIRSLGAAINVISGAMAGGERIYRVLDGKDEIEPTREAAGKPPMPTVTGAIDVEGVSFSYHHDQPVLKDVNLIVNPGDTVGIVGLTGAGKTTLMMLLARFYDPDKGKVRIDGYDIRTIQIDTLRQQIGIVFQDPFLFSATITDNIRFGRPEASLEEVYAAATAACLHDFVLTLPEGYDTQLGERGITLSGGQRQRLSL